ncbi:hypothetical protein D1010_10510 [Schleiferilactobacillus harbinensis]|uniref:Uncharacterized protein n=1 Tax=Schleiferilactobacillus harbinensis TaxID=304207 RepID=A0A5P8M5M1_9LACO|nr:hypothetical protein D1010_10510 [Schleiferilactobacillus harbinensis]
MDFSLLGNLVHSQSPYSCFLFISSGLCFGLSSDSTSRWTPCRRLVVPTTSAYSGLSPPS